VIVDERAHRRKAGGERAGLGRQTRLEIDDVVRAVRIGLIEELAIK
jgi:hypothetical protein